MWFKFKNRVDVNKGDTIKNSNININKSDDSAILMEIFHKMGRVEGTMKCMKEDIKYIKTHIEDHTERISKLEHSLFRKD